MSGFSSVVVLLISLFWPDGVSGGWWPSKGHPGAKLSADASSEGALNFAVLLKYLADLGGAYIWSVLISRRYSCEKCRRNRTMLVKDLPTEALANRSLSAHIRLYPECILQLPNVTFCVVKPPPELWGFCFSQFPRSMLIDHPVSGPWRNLLLHRWLVVWSQSPPRWS